MNNPELAAYIIDAVVAATGLCNSKCLQDKSCTRDVVAARDMAMYLIRKHTNPQMSLADIGELFGGRCHALVLSACDREWRRLNVEREQDRQVGGESVRRQQQRHGRIMHAPTVFSVIQAR